MSVNLCVCLSANSSKTANPIELKFCGMIPFGVQMDLGKTISGLDQPFAKNSKKKKAFTVDTSETNCPNDSLQNECYTFNSTKLDSTETMTSRLNNYNDKLIKKLFSNKASRNQYNFVLAQPLVLFF